MLGEPFNPSSEGVTSPCIADEATRLPLSLARDRSQLVAECLLDEFMANSSKSFLCVLQFHNQKVNNPSMARLCSHFDRTYIIGIPPAVFRHSNSGPVWLDAHPLVY